MLKLQLEDKDPAPFAQAVLDILNSTFSDDDAFAPKDAAAALNKLYPSHRLEEDTKSEPGGQFLWWFWDLFHDLARQIPHDSLASEQFAAIVKELHDIEPVEDVHLGSDWGDSQLWRKLPLLGPVFHEKWNQDPLAPDGTDKQQRELNFQTYAARITGLGLVPFEMYAIWALSAALEGEITPIRGAPDEVNADPSAVENLTFKIAAARAWIVHAGRILYGRDEEIRGTLGGPLYMLDKKEAAKLRHKYKGTQGLCPQRWQLWKERFEIVGASEKVSTDTRISAKEALDVMEDIEADNRRTD